MHQCMHNHVIALSESARKNFFLLIAKSKQFGNFPFEAFMQSGVDIRLTLGISIS